NEPGIGCDLLKILDHIRVPYALVASEACCGMPKLELGDLASVEALKDVNIPVLAPLARAGYAILTAVPSCTLMFKQELPLLFPDDADVLAVAEAMFDPFEYIVARVRARARQGQLSHSLPRARAEHRPEDARGAGMDSRYVGQYRRTLLGTRR